MEPSVLRSRLCYAVEELQFLTTQELVECNWSVIQRVFSILFEKSRSLREYSDRIGDLMEARNVELQNRKMAPEKKDGWKDKNANFKTSFMRIIIDGLSYLRWPPSLVAFSDPLEKLLSDPKDAIAFVLEFGIEVEVTRHTRLKRSDIATSPVSRTTHSEEDQDSRVAVSPRQLSFSSGVGSNDEHISIGSDDRQHYGRETRRPLSARRGEKPRPSSGSSQKPQRLSQDAARAVEIMTMEYEESDQNRTPVDFKKFSLSFQVLQHQNEVLSRQLKRLQESVCARDRAETCLGAILTEFRAQIDEIVGISKPDKNDPPAYHIPDLSQNSLLTPTLDEEFRQEVMREKEAEKRSKEDLNNFSGLGKSVYVTKKNEIRAKTAERIVEARIGTGVSKGTQPKGITIIFCKLQEKLKRLEKEWIEARSSVTASFGAVEVHSQCETYLPHQKDTEKKGGRGKESTFNNSRGWDGTKGDRPGTIQDTGSFSNLGYKIRMHQVLGVKPPLALLAADPDAGLTNLRHGLNLQRIHLLQKDLVSFAEDAFSFFSPERNPTANTVEVDKYPKSFREKIRPERSNFTLDPFPSSALNSEKQMKLLSLYSRSQELILHLSCLAPLSPLAVDPPLSTCMSGLEALEKDLMNIIPNLSGGTGQKAQIGSRLQGSLDRAKSEQLNLIRSLQSSNSMLYQWAAAADKVVPIFSTFGSNASDPSLRARRELLDLSSCISSVTVALDAAEGSRIFLPEGLAVSRARSGSIVPGKRVGAGTHGQAPGVISPLDCVSRGYLGEEMSVLVNALRSNKEDLRQLPRAMEVLARLQASDNTGSLRAFEDAKSRVLGAAEVTRSALSAMEHSCHSSGG